MKQSNKHDQRPSMQFYPDDWIAEPGLRLCSLEAKGLWIELLCIMFRLEKRGFLSINNKQITSKMLSKMLAESEDNIIKSLQELKENDVYSTLDDGTIYSRRMARNWHISKVRSEAGSKGGKVSKKNKQKESKVKQTVGEGVGIEEETGVGKGIVVDIINDLNEILKTSYKATSKKNIELITARINEGFTVEDFKKVHRNMAKRWGADNKMREFLRPITLYSNKLESYLNIKQELPFSTQTAKNIQKGREWAEKKELEENG